MLKADSVHIDNLPIIYLDTWSDLDVSKLTAVTETMDTAKVSFKDQALRKITMSSINIAK
jgi:hypothetical protein